MKIMSFNTQHCFHHLDRKIDYPAMAAAIRGCDADLVGLNEIRGEGPAPEFEAQTERLAELAGMPYCFFAPALHMRAGTYGNAMLSRVPIESAEIIMIPDPDPRGYDGYYETRCLLKAKLAGGITVLVTHFGLNPDEMENAVATVMDHLTAEKCILMGDFNVLPEDPVLAPIRARMKDTAEVFDGVKYSFPSDKPDRKIDYIFVSPDVEVVAADIPALAVSDHRPHTAEIRLKTEKNCEPRLEIERKFLIDGFPELEPLRCAETEQGYLCHEPVVRIRRSSSGGVDKYKLCFKGKGTLVRTELEKDLTAAEYAQLYDLLPEATVKKEFRTYALADGLVLECSHVDPGEPTSFYYAEVEFPDEAAAAAFVPPAFLGRDVTEDPGFTMSHYAKVKREKGEWPWASKKE